MSAILKSGVVTEVALADLARDPQQPRQTFDEGALASLGESLKIRIEHPLKVRYDGKRLVIVDGERRWRAAKLVKLKTLPCLLDEQRDQLDIAATQLATSAQREALGPMDIADFLAGLQTRGKLTTNDLLAALSKRGIKEIGTEKLDRYLRFVELPTWFKDYVRKGVLTESHAAVMLGTLAYPDIVKELKDDIAKHLSWQGGYVLKDFKEEIEGTFMALGIDLNRTHGKPEEMRKFPIDPCRTCQFYKKIGKRELCLNEKEFKKKQDAALALIADKANREKTGGADAKEVETDPTKVKPRQLKQLKGIVITKGLRYGTFNDLENAQFDQGQCETCPHRQRASHDGSKEDSGYICTHVPCYDLKTTTASKLKGRTLRMREYLEAWLRPRVLDVIRSGQHGETTTPLLVWLATGAVDHGFHYGEYGSAGQMEQSAAAQTKHFLFKHSLQELPQFFRPWTPAEFLELAAHAVAAMTREQLRWFARHLELTLAPYLVDETYLRMKRKAELGDLAKLCPSITSVANVTGSQLRELLLIPENRSAIGVPADLAALYVEAFEKPTNYGSGDMEDQEELEEALQEETVCIECGCSHYDPCEIPCGWLIRGEDKKGQSVGVCTTPDCALGLARWKQKDFTLSAAATARRQERHSMILGRELAGAGGVLAQVAAAVPARKGKRS